MNNLDQKIKTAYARRESAYIADRYAAFNRTLKKVLELDEDIYPTSQRGAMMYYQINDTQRLRYKYDDHRSLDLEFRQWGRWIASHVERIDSLCEIGDAIEHFERRGLLKKVVSWLVGTDF